jgi:hypothetical protein
MAWFLSPSYQSNILLKEIIINYSYLFIIENHSSQELGNGYHTLLKAIAVSCSVCVAVCNQSLIIVVNKKILNILFKLGDNSHIP